MELTSIRLPTTIHAQTLWLESLDPGLCLCIGHVVEEDAFCVVGGYGDGSVLILNR
jgi:hypothetical protein